MEVGDSTTRTLTLAAEGLLSSQLPSITSMSDHSKSAGIRVYPDQESSDQIERTDGFLGQRTRSEALVASGGGSWTLPEVSVPWWNTETDTLQFATLPSTTISVGTPVIETPGALDMTQVAAKPSSPPYWLTALAASGWLLATVLSWIVWRSRQRVNTEPSNPQPEDRLRPLLTALKASTAQRDAALTRDLLMRWATVHFGETVRTFQQLRSLCSDALAQETYILERTLYASGDEQWPGAKPFYSALRSEPPPTSPESTMTARRLYPTG